MPQTDKPSLRTAATDPPESARTKLMDAGLRLFAARGFDGSSTRDIAEMAGVNISAIRYYFGDKAGLYRAVYTEALQLDEGTLPEGADDTRRPVNERLLDLFREFLDPLKKGEALRLAMKIHFREMIEPSGDWESIVHAVMQEQHQRLLDIMKAALQVSDTDLEMQRMAFSLLGMAVHFYVGHDFAAKLSPGLVDSADAIDVLAERLTHYATAVLKAESRRRTQHLKGS